MAFLLQQPEQTKIDGISTNLAQAKHGNSFRKPAASFLFSQFHR